MRLHHVQISIPRGGEEVGRRFYGEALGLQEVTKPPSLVGRGGCRFRAFDGDVVTAELHLGVDDAFHPAEKAHPGLVLGTLIELEATAARIEPPATSSPGRSGTPTRGTSASMRATASATVSR